MVGGKKILLVGVALIAFLLLSTSSIIGSPPPHPTIPVVAPQPTRVLTQQSPTYNSNVRPQLKPTTGGSNGAEGEPVASTTTSTTSTVKREELPNTLHASDVTLSQGLTSAAGVTSNQRPSISNDDLEQLVKETVTRCNADGKNNVGHKKVSCVFCRNAVITADNIYCDPEASAEARAAMGSGMSVGRSEFPPGTPGGRGTRHHLKTITVSFEAPPSPLQSFIQDGETDVGYYQSPVSGAMFLNVWHTVADFAFMMFHTLSPIIEQQVERGSGGVEASIVTWLTRTAFKQMGRGCFDAETCSSLPLFDLLDRMVGHGRSRVLRDGKRKTVLRYRYLIFGLNTRCSPIPTEDVGTPDCHRTLFGLRNRLLKSYDLPADLALTERDARCPRVHIMSRQRDRYRKITPFGDFLQAFRDYYRRINCSTELIAVVSLTTSVPMKQQLESVANSTILVAGRGGGTTLSIFLPLGGGYLSISGFDRWNPFRDLVPKWLEMGHHTTTLVHHENPQKPPQKFGSGKNSYIDPNRAGYLVTPSKVIDDFSALSARMQRRFKKEGPATADEFLRK